MFAQQRKSLRHVPRGMAEFNDQGILSKPPQQAAQVDDGFLRAMKRERELRQDSAQFFFGHQNIETEANFTLVAQAGCGIMCKSLPQLRGEHKLPIRRHACNPLLGLRHAQRPVKGSIYFNGVEKAREIIGFVESLGTRRGINHAAPILICPAGGPHA